MNRGRGKKQRDIIDNTDRNKRLKGIHRQTRKEKSLRCTRDNIFIARFLIAPN